LRWPLDFVNVKDIDGRFLRFQFQTEFLEHLKKGGQIREISFAFFSLGFLQ